MNSVRLFLSMIVASALVALAGCAVSRGQESVGAYIDDATITTAVKSSFVREAKVDASAISVETLNGTVLLSGFARNADEKSVAEDLAMQVKGVKSVRNEIVVASR